MDKKPIHFVLTTLYKLYIVSGVGDVTPIFKKGDNMVYEVDAKAIGEKLKALRGYTPRRVVAEDLGIPESTLTSYEQGERIPRDITKVAIARYYNVDLTTLFFTKKPIRNV